MYFNWNIEWYQSIQLKVFLIIMKRCLLLFASRLCMYQYAGTHVGRAAQQKYSGIG